MTRVDKTGLALQFFMRQVNGLNGRGHRAGFAFDGQWVVGCRNIMIPLNPPSTPQRPQIGHRHQWNLHSARVWRWRPFYCPLFPPLFLFVSLSAGWLLPPTHGLGLRWPCRGGYYFVLCVDGVDGRWAFSQYYYSNWTKQSISDHQGGEGGLQAATKTAKNRGGHGTICMGRWRCH